jgi:hypothetical protein
MSLTSTKRPPRRGRGRGGLPQPLFWALAFLRRSLPGIRKPDHETFMTTECHATRLAKETIEPVVNRADLQHSAETH